jgi:hypothetical protein
MFTEHNSEIIKYDISLIILHYIYVWAIDCLLVLT